MSQIQQIFESNSVRTLIALIAIGVSVLLFWLNRKRKSLAYEVVRNTKLFNVDASLRSKIEIKIDGVVASELTLIIIDIQNIGNEPIKREDFDSPLRFTFGTEGEVISARVLGSRPTDLGAVLRSSKADVTLEPLLLNNGDGFSAEILLGNDVAKVTHSARIVGISEVRSMIGSNGKLGYTVPIVSLFAGGLSAIVSSTQAFRHLVRLFQAVDASPATFVTACILTSLVSIQTVRFMRKSRSGRRGRVMWF